MKFYVLPLLLCLLLGGVFGTVAQDDDEELDLRYIAERVVRIGVVINGQIIGNGSGTIVDPTGTIFTNRHVVEQADDLAIFVLDDIEELPVLRYYASPVQFADQVDFAILQIDRDADGNPIDPASLNLPYLPIEVESADIGDEVNVFGYPGIGDGYMVVTSGEVVTIQSGTVNGERVPVWYRTDTEFSSGNSGGLAVNNDGALVGIPTWVVTDQRTNGKLGGILPLETVLVLLGGAQQFAQAQGAEEPPSITLEEAPSPSGVSQQFTLRNQSETAVCFVYISPTTASTWGEDRLGDEEIIEPETTRTFEVEADYYDILLTDCDGEELSDNRNVDLTTNTTLTYTGEQTVDAPTIRQGISVSCGEDIAFENGVEIIMNDVPAGVQYRVTALGIDGFDPIVAVFNAAGEGLCADDTDVAADYSVELPTINTISNATRGAQVGFVREETDSDALSIIVGGFDNQSGDFVLILEGAALGNEEQFADVYSLTLTENVIGNPFGVYMLGVTQELDGMIEVVNGSGDLVSDATGDVIVCDDAGSERCWTEIEALSDSTIVTPEQASLTGDQLDPALFFSAENLADFAQERQSLSIRATSFNEDTPGDYVMVFQLGIE